MSASRKPSVPRQCEPCITVRRLGGKCTVHARRIIRAVRQTAGDHPITSLSVAIVDDARMSELHDRYMGDSSPTDVLSFDLRDNQGFAALEGEIVVSSDTARREARIRRLDEADELLRYVIHGVLHLLGMDDHTAAGRRQMRREETRILKKMKTVASRPRRTSTRKASRTVS